jgi:hypothetical protein
MSRSSPSPITHTADPELQRPAPIRLKITDHKGFEKVVLLDGRPFSIGTSEDCDLCLPAAETPGVLPRHLTIAKEGDSWMLREESNGTATRVNGELVRRAALGEGDHISIGDGTWRIVFLMEGSRAVDIEHRRLRTLLHVLRQMYTSLDPEEISARAVVAIMDLLGTSWVAILHGTDAGRLRVVAAGDADGRLPSHPTRVAQEVYNSESSSLQPDHLCVTISARRGVIGAVEVGPRDAAPYTQSDLEILESIAVHVGLAASNAELLADQPLLNDEPGDV